MKGFEIYINDKKINTVANRGTIVIVVGKTSFTIGGIDNEKGISEDWERIELCMGDKIKITALDTKTSSTPIKTELLDRQQLLAEYYSLKDFLTKEGKLQ